MREIKFRAWTGAQMEHRVVVGALGAFYVEGIDPEDSACMSPFNTKYSDQTPVMQFTGLRDRNGKEIYEGDIVASSRVFEGQRERTICKVVWLEDACFGLWWHDDPEIIGNIYETPELLTKQLEMDNGWGLTGGGFPLRS